MSKCAIFDARIIELLLDMKRVKFFAVVILVSSSLFGMNTTQAQEVKVAYAGNYQTSFQNVVEKSYAFEATPTVTTDHVLSGKVTMIQTKFVDTLLDPELGTEFTANKVGLGFISKDGDTLLPVFEQINQWKEDRFLVSYKAGDELEHFLVNGKGQLVDYCTGGWNKFVYVKSGNYWGILGTEDAKEIVPVQYQSIMTGKKLADGWEQQVDNSSVSKESATGIAFHVMKNDKWGIAETFVGEIIVCKFDKISEAMVDNTAEEYNMNDERPHTIFVVTLENKQGLLHYSGQALTPILFDYVGYPNFKANAILVKFGDQWGAIDTRGKKIINCNYFDVDIMNGEVVTFAVKVSSKWACYDHEGNEILPAEYDKIKRYYPKSKTFAVKLNGKWGKVNHKGKIIIPFEYDEFDREAFAD